MEKVVTPAIRRKKLLILIDGLLSARNLSQGSIRLKKLSGLPSVAVYPRRKGVLGVEKNRYIFPF